MGSVQSVYRSYQEAGTVSDESYEPGDTPLHTAARSGSLEAVQHFLSAGGDCNATNDACDTPLHCAVHSGNRNVVRVLLQHGANAFDAENSHRITPLHDAVLSGNPNTVQELICTGAGMVNSNHTLVSCAVRQQNWDILLILVENGFEINMNILLSECRHSPLIYAAMDGHWQAVQVLLDAGAGINSVDDSNSYTALHYAAKKGHLLTVTGLLSEGSYCNATTVSGETPLYLAVSSCHWNVARLLLNSGANVNRENRYGNTPLHVAAERSHFEMVTGLVLFGGNPHSTNKNGETPLHYAASKGDWNVMQVLLDVGAIVNAVERNGNTPLHYAAKCGAYEAVNGLLAAGADSSVCNSEKMTSLVIAISRKHSNVMMLLMNNGATLHFKDLNVPDKRGYFLLHYATASGNLEAVNTLLLAGADCNSRATSDKRTPLICAAVRSNWHIMEQLLAAGADINMVDNKGNSPLHYVAEVGNLEIVTRLLGLGADCNIANKEHCTPLNQASFTENWNVLQALLTHGADINSRDRWGKTTLHSAIERNNLNCVRGLLSHGAVINARDKRGDTPLHSSVRSHHLNCMRELLSHGADCNAVNLKNRTPLHCAAIKGDSEMLQLLLEGGADIHASDSRGCTPLHNAVRFDGEPLMAVTTLMSAGADCCKKDTSGFTSVDYAVNVLNCNLLEAMIPSGTNISILTKLRNRSLYIRELLLATNANVNAVDCEGSNALHKSVYNGNMEWLMALLSLGPDYYAVQSTNYVPFIYLRRRWETKRGTPKDDVAIIQALLRFGIDARTVDSHGNSFLHHAVELGSYKEVSALVCAGANRYATNSYGLTALDSAVIRNHWDILHALLPIEADSQFDTVHDLERLLRASEVNLNVRDGNTGDTALHNAVRYADTESIRGLILAGADCNILDRHGCTPLHRIVNKSFEEDIVQFLLDRGAEVNAADRDGNTALHKISSSDTAIVKILIAAGGNINATNNLGRTPLHVASNEGWCEYLSILLNYGADVNLGDKKWDTSLHLAVRSGMLGCVKLLVSASLRTVMYLLLYMLQVKVKFQKLIYI